MLAAKNAFVFLLLLLALCLATQMTSQEYDQAFLDQSFGSQEYNNTMMWGTYRPGIYFGMKTRSKNPVINGLMWYSASNDAYVQNVRHNCDMNDKTRYGWTRHDGRNFGEQVIEDKQNNVVITTEFLKRTKGLSNGGEWTIRVSGKKLTGAAAQKISLLYYVGLENIVDTEDDSLYFNIAGVKGTKAKGINNPVVISINKAHEDIGRFSMYVKEGKTKRSSETLSPEEQLLEKFHFAGKRVNGDQVWKVKDWVQQSLQQAAFKQMAKQMSDNQQGTKPKNPKPIITFLPNSMEPESNVVVLQKIVQAPFSFDIVLVSHDNHEQLKNADIEDTSYVAAVKAVAEPVITSFADDISDAKKLFDSRFSKIFALSKTSQYINNSTTDKERLTEFGKWLLSSLIGGMGYFYGDALHKYEGRQEPSRVGPYPLFTAVPTRSFFPRGFLWDEGFHELVIQNWDMEITKEVLSHWMNSMEPNGWIPREQILGNEARSRVPAEFQVQQSLHANPPMHFLALLSMLEKVQQRQKHAASVSVSLTGESHAVNVETPEQRNIHSTLNFLKTLYPLLKKNYQWYVQTQKGLIEGSFKWRGRTPGHTLASGLDDYPRGNDEPTDDERHLDLYSWMYMMADVMVTMRKLIEPTNEQDADLVEYRGVMAKLVQRLDEFHWNKDIEWYSDYAGRPTGNETRSEYSNHIGYINLFPLFFGVIPPSSETYTKGLKFMRNRNHMWSNYGLRSLSKADSLFGTKENYWRGPIWMNINYLTLRGLNKASQENSKASTYLEQLRDHVVKTVFTDWKKTGTVHEQYHPENGSGQRAHPFTGWTTTILLAMSDLY